MADTRVRLVLITAIALVVAGTLVHARWGYFHEDLSGHARGSDDAYISYRYARQLVSGNELVFNPGERVEGYSNLGYVLLLAPLVAVLPDRGVYTASLILNLACAAGAVAVLAAAIRRRWGLAAAAAGATLMAAHPATWLWTASGMETPLVLLLQVGLFAEARREDTGGGGRLAVLAALLCLARADGFVGAGLVALGLLAEGQRAAGLRTGAAAVATTLALMGARLAYYGYPLPNTYYAKVSGPLAERVRDALDQLGDVALEAGLLPALVLLAVAVVVALRARRPSLEAVFGLGWLAYWIYVGGDVFGERFLLVLVPLGALVLARFTSTWRADAVIAAWGLVALAQLAPLAADRRFRYAGGEKYDRWIELGRLLGRPEHRGRTLAIDAAGKVPLLSGLATIDMLGLTDAHRPPLRDLVPRRPQQARCRLRPRAPARPRRHLDGRGPEPALGVGPRALRGGGIPRAVAGLHAPPSARRRARDHRPVTRGEGAAGDLVRRGWSYAVLERVSGGRASRGRAGEGESRGR